MFKGGPPWPYAPPGPTGPPAPKDVEFRFWAREMWRFSLGHVGVLGSLGAHWDLGLGLGLAESSNGHFLQISQNSIENSKNGIPTAS